MYAMVSFLYLMSRAPCSCFHFMMNRETWNKLHLSLMKSLQDIIVSVAESINKVVE